MLLRWSFGRGDAAEAIEAAVETALDDGYRTRDLVPAGASDTAPRSTSSARSGMTEAILERLPSYAGTAARR